MHFEAPATLYMYMCAMAGGAACIVSRGLWGCGEMFEHRETQFGQRLREVATNARAWLGIGKECKQLQVARVRGAIGACLAMGAA